MVKGNTDKRSKTISKPKQPKPKTEPISQRLTRAAQRKLPPKDLQEDVDEITRQRKEEKLVEFEISPELI